MKISPRELMQLFKLYNELGYIPQQKGEDIQIIRDRGLTQWLAECCVPKGETDLSFWTSGRDIMESYMEWCEYNKVRPLTRKAIMFLLRKGGYNISIQDPSGESKLRGIWQYICLNILIWNTK